MLKKPRKGAPFKPSATAQAAFVDAAEYVQRLQSSTSVPGGRDVAQAAILPIQNGSGGVRAKFDVLGIDDVFPNPGDDLDAFKAGPILEGVTPDTADHLGRFAILLGPAGTGDVVLACLAGVCVARIDVSHEGHLYADAKDGDCGALASGIGGAAAILWKQAGTGVKWAMVQLGVRQLAPALITGTLTADLDPADDFEITGVTVLWPPGAAAPTSPVACTNIFAAAGDARGRVIAFWNQHTETWWGPLVMCPVSTKASPAAGTPSGGLDLLDHFLGDYPPAGTAFNCNYGWTKVETNGLGVTGSDQADGVLAFAFDAVTEAATAALYMANAPFHVDDGIIFEAKLAIHDVGDSGALDINIGLANDSHATDFDAITEYIAFHLDGGSLSIRAQGTDGTTTVPATYTGVKATEDTFITLKIDCTDLKDCKFYIDGVRVLPDTSFDISEITGTLTPICHIEKSSDDTTADVRVDWIHCRQAGVTTTVGPLDLLDHFLGDYPAAGTAYNCNEGWSKYETNGLGVTGSDQADGVLAFAFDAVTEAATAALYIANAPFHIDDGIIFEAKVAIYDIGDDAALDINIGLANDNHATDFDALTEYIAIHLDGASLDILAQSTDGTTTVTATDTTVNAVDDTFFTIRIDCTDPTDCEIYIDDVRVLDGTTFDISQVSGTLTPICHIEKSADDTTADVRVDWMHCYLEGVTTTVGPLDFLDHFLGDYPPAGTAFNCNYGWTKLETNGLGVTGSDQADGVLSFAFDAVTEAATAALYMDKAPFSVSDGIIFEARVAIYDIGDDAALDINIGLANDNHATDFDALTEYIAIHLDGASLDILAQSTDGTTTVTATDTTVDAVEGTFFTVRIDCTDLSDCGIYIDYVRVLSGTTFDISEITGTLSPVCHVEKSSDDTTADVRVDWIRCRNQS